MCRWLPICADPIRPEQILYDPQHSLIKQSWHALKGLGGKEPNQISAHKEITNLWEVESPRHARSSRSNEERC
jgi:hypothetical protein